VNQEKNKKLISLICPVFNEEETIPIFYKRILAVVKPLQVRYDFELIFTNNCSTDRSLEIIQGYCRQDSMVKVLTLSRNFGYQRSVLAGLTHAGGEGIVIIDVDCEDPPEMIPRFLSEWEKGYDIVYGKRESRPEPLVIRLMRKLFYRLNKMIGDAEIILDMAEFSLISSHIRDAIIANNTTYPFLRTEIGYIGFNRIGIPYTREKRVAGETHFSLISMTQIAMGGILTSSTFPLRLTMYFAVPLIFINILFAFLELSALFEGSFKILVMLDLLYMIFSIPFISIYVARIYNDGMARPKFFIDWLKSDIDGANHQDTIT
jgi:dolichol-phosphate mannosyltransferase